MCIVFDICTNNKKTVLSNTRKNKKQIESNIEFCQVLKHIGVNAMK